MAIVTITNSFWANDASRIVAAAYGAGARSFIAADRDLFPYAYDFQVDVPGFADDERVQFCGSCACDNAGSIDRFYWFAATLR